jgi:hypothetical protein
MTWASGHLLWNAEDLGCRVGFWGGPRADDRLTRWRHRQGQDRTMPRDSKGLTLIPFLGHRNEGIEPIKMWYANKAMDLDTIFDQLVTVHPVTKDTTP